MEGNDKQNLQANNRQYTKRLVTSLSAQFSKAKLTPPSTNRAST